MHLLTPPEKPRRSQRNRSRKRHVAGKSTSKIKLALLSPRRGEVVSRRRKKDSVRIYNCNQRKSRARVTKKQEKRGRILKGVEGNLSPIQQGAKMKAVIELKKEIF